MNEKQSPSTLKGIPRYFERPIWKDPFFWLILAMIVFWVLVIRWLFF